MFEKPVILNLPNVSIESFKQYLPYIGISLGLAGILISFGVLFIDPVVPAVQAESSGICVTQSFKGDLVIYVSGAVAKPGIYHLSSGSRLADGLSTAGGALPSADQAYLQREANLAKELEDSQHLYIPFAQERGGAETTNTSDTNTTANSSASTTTNSDTTIPSNPSSTKLISINTASQSELESLPKVGEKTAEKIIAGRPYADLLELVKNKVVSQSVYDEIEAEISL